MTTITYGYLIAEVEHSYRDDSQGPTQIPRSRHVPRSDDRANMSAASSLTSIRTGDMNIDNTTGRPRPAPRRKGERLCNSIFILYFLFLFAYLFILSMAGCVTSFLYHLDGTAKMVSASESMQSIQSNTLQNPHPRYANSYSQQTISYY